MQQESRFRVILKQIVEDKTLVSAFFIGIILVVADLGAEVTASAGPSHCWHFVVDNLDTHRSESLVRWVARESGLDLELGQKGQWGILKNRESRGQYSNITRCLLEYSEERCQILMTVLSQL